MDRSGPQPTITSEAEFFSSGLVLTGGSFDGSNWNLDFDLFALNGVNTSTVVTLTPGQGPGGTAES